MNFDNIVSSQKHESKMTLMVVMVVYSYECDRVVSENEPPAVHRWKKKMPITEMVRAGGMCLLNGF